MGYRRFLPPDHPWRKNKTSFNRNHELHIAPKILLDDELLQQLEYLDAVTSERQRLE